MFKECASVCVCGRVCVVCVSPVEYVSPFDSKSFICALPVYNLNQMPNVCVCMAIINPKGLYGIL